MVRVSLLLAVLTADLARADPAVDLTELNVDVEVERLACHGPPEEPALTHAEACTRAQQAHEAGDISGLCTLVEIMQHHDPGRAQACTARFDEEIEANPPHRREDYRAGLAAMKAGLYARARACFRLTLAEDPYHQVAARRLGEVEAAIERQAAEDGDPVPAPEEEPGPH
jgi:hypothetical protein